MSTEIIGEIIGIIFMIFLVFLLCEISPYGDDKPVKKKRPDEPIVPHF